MAASTKDFYALLNVSPKSSTEDLKRAYRQLARQHHPDVAVDKVQSEVLFKEITEAYEILRDPEKRKLYNQYGPDLAPPEPAAAPAPSVGFKDFLKTLFKSEKPASTESRSPWTTDGRTPARIRAGQDTVANFQVTLEEVASGAIRPVILRQAEGVSRQRADSQQGYQVRIPQGIQENQHIRLVGQGAPGIGGGPAGDLYLRVRYAPHPHFTTREGHIYHELEIRSWEATLGAQVRIPVLDGQTLLQIPPRSTMGTQLRLRGRGLPLPGGGYGDMLITLRVRATAAPFAYTAAPAAELEETGPIIDVKLKPAPAFAE